MISLWVFVFIDCLEVAWLVLCGLGGLFGFKVPFESSKSSCWDRALFPLEVFSVCLQQGQPSPPVQVTLPSKSLHLDKPGFRRPKK